ncbi:MAG: phosphatase PAP2 family protein [Candidatus Doudnabacteria bacterium]|nr:phosphatase PAP2 family protein [Candidatus Doudnabacteria bacterium]
MLELDIKIFRIINNLAEKSGFWDKFFIYGTRYSILIFSVILVLYLFKRRRVFWTALLSAALSRGIFTELIRYFYHRKRPFVALPDVKLLIEKNGLEASFPSGHAAYMFAIAFAVWLFNRKIGAILIIAALILSFGRVYVGVHYPGDILGGIAVAAISVLAVRSFRRRA